MYVWLVGTKNLQPSLLSADAKAAACVYCLGQGPCFLTSPSSWHTPPLFSAAWVLLPELHSLPGKQGHSYLFKIDIFEKLREVYVRFGQVV